MYSLWGSGQNPCWPNKYSNTTVRKTVTGSFDTVGRCKVLLEKKSVSLQSSSLKHYVQNYSRQDASDHLWLSSRNLDSVPLHSSSRLWDLDFQMKCKAHFEKRRLWTAEQQSRFVSYYGLWECNTCSPPQVLESWIPSRLLSSMLHLCRLSLQVNFPWIRFHTVLCQQPAPFQQRPCAAYPPLGGSQWEPSVGSLLHHFDKSSSLLRTVWTEYLEFFFPFWQEILNIWHNILVFWDTGF